MTSNDTNFSVDLFAKSNGSIKPYQFLLFDHVLSIELKIIHHGATNTIMARTDSFFHVLSYLNKARVCRLAIALCEMPVVLRFPTNTSS